MFHFQFIFQNVTSQAKEHHLYEKAISKCKMLTNISK